MKRLLAIVLCSIAVSPAVAGVGQISALSGQPATIQRKAAKLPGTLHASIDPMDVVSTVKGTGVNIDFIDKTKVKITENSRLVIDDFVFDPKHSDASKLALKVSMGTVRYASGQIAKINQQKVNIQTPTASIAVRGTDFHMTVDEAGRSLVVLVPSCREEPVKISDKPEDKKDTIENCYVGKITVKTDGGVRELDKAFEATYVASASEIPNETVILKFSTLDSRIDPQGEINNNLIIVPPAEVKAQINAKAEQKKEAAEQEAESATQRAQATKKEETLPASIVKVTTSTSDAKTCHEKIRCVEFNPYITFYRESEGNYAEVKFKGIDSNVSLTINQNGDDAKLPWGPAPTSGNVVIIKQSK